MSKMMSSIKTNTDNYKLDEIDCFEKPFGIILESYNDNYCNAFYMVLKFYQSYNTKKYEFNGLPNLNSRMKIDVDIVNEIFNIKCEKLSPSDDISEFIKNKLMLNTKVLIPGNLKELYYAPEYKLENKPHLFTIKGFDKDRGTYLIVDSMHLRGEGYKYDDFFIEEDTLELLYNSSCKDMDVNDIYCFSSKTDEVSVSIYDIVTKCINLYEMTMDEQPYKEIDYMNIIMDVIRNKQNINSNIVIEKQGVKEEYSVYNLVVRMKNTIKFKNVFLSELVNNLSLYISDNNFLKELIEEKQIIIEKWNKITDIAITNLHRRKLFNVSKELDEVIEEEKHLRLLISSAKSMLISIDKNYDYTNKTNESNELLTEKKVMPELQADVKAKVEYAAPKNKIQEKLVSIWSEVLTVEKLGIDDDFFELGGHSLKAIQISAILIENDITIKVSDIYENATIRKLENYISNRFTNNELKSIENNEIKITKPIEGSQLYKNNMSNIIAGVAENDDKYSWEELNCFYRPIAIILKYIKPEYFDLFLFNVSYYSSFMADGWFSDISEVGMEESFLKFYKSVLYEKLGVQFDRIEYSNAEDMHKKIKEQIDNDCPVLVPGDLFELNYYPMYKELSHKHYFIIKGYNTEKCIYNILDNMQIDGGSSTIYKDFFIGFSDLEKVNSLYCTSSSYNNSKPYFYSIIHNDEVETYDFNFYDAILDHSNFLKEANSNDTKITYLEYKMAEDVKKLVSNLDSRIDQINGYMWFMSSVANFKPVYYDILFKYLDRLNVSKVKMDSLKDIKNEILSNWRNIRFEIMDKVVQQDFSFNNVTVNIESNKSKEAIFRNTLIEVIKELNMKELIKLQKSKDKYTDFIEYNKNNAEILKTKDGIKFILKENKKYDIWISEDYGPQVLKVVNSNDFSIEGKLDLNYGQQEVTFHDGIIIKYGSGMKVLFGIVKEAHKYNKLVIYYPNNKNYIIYEEPYLYEGNIYLKVEKIKNDYIFYEKKDSENNWKNIFVLTVDELIKNVGFFSKTWEYVNHNIEISDIKFSYINS